MAKTLKVSCPIKPFDHIVVVQIEKVEEVSKGGIFLDAAKKTIDSEQLNMTEGILVAIGINAYDYLPKDVRPTLGMHVLFKKYCGILKIIDGKAFILMNDIDVMGEYAVK